MSDWVGGLLRRAAQATPGLGGLLAQTVLRIPARCWAIGASAN